MTFFYFPGGLKSIPTQSIDSLIQSIIIKGPRNFLTLSSIFQTFNKLEELRITDSNIPTIGKNTFWGVPSLKIIGKHKQIMFYILFITIQIECHFVSNI